MGTRSSRSRGTNLGPYYGDDVTPLDLVPGTPSIGVATTILADTAGVQEYNKRIYGAASPAPGTAPIKDLEAIGAYTFTLDLETGTVS